MTKDEGRKTTAEGRKITAGWKIKGETMKKFFCAAAGMLTILFLMCAWLSAAELKDEIKKVGVGFSLGTPTGVNAKLWFSHVKALDITVGWGYWNYWVKADYLWHDWKAIKENKDMKIPLYYGVGGFVGGLKDDSGFGPEGIIGFDFMLKRSPFDFFVEAGPAVQLAGNSGLFIRLALGARYYFNQSKKN